MRQPQRGRRGSQNATSDSVAAPVGGWNVRDPLALMEPTDAVTLDNFIPTPSVCKLRRGNENHVTGITGNVESLMEYRGISASKLFAAANSAIYNVSVAGAVGAADVSGLTNNRWQHTMFATSGGNFLVIANGADSVRNYDGTTWTTPAITGGTSSTFIHVQAHQSRLFFVQKNTLTFWYLGTSAIAGAATSFNIGPLCRKGGYLLAMGSWTGDSGRGMDDRAVFVTSEGEVVVYEGTDPASASTWALVGVYHIPRPLGGPRCMMQLGGDLVILTEEGVYNLSKVLSVGEVQQSIAITDKIRGQFSIASRVGRSFFGWEGILYPRGEFVLFNIPTSNGVASDQYVMNTTLGSWCRLKGQNSFCWSLFQGDLYYGGTTKVVKSDSGTDDFGDPIPGTVKPAFNYFQTPGRLKRFTAARPVFLSEGNISPALVLNVDFQDTEPTSIPTFSGVGGSPWDTSPWDTSPWGSSVQIRKDWQGITGIGYCGTLKIKTTSSNVGLELAAIDYVYETGGVIG